jgi:hypothetical protein
MIENKAINIRRTHPKNGRQQMAQPSAEVDATMKEK